MKNLEATYQSLISLENLKSLTNETALERIGQLTDPSLDLQKTNGLKHAIKLSEELQKRKLTSRQLATSHYFLANAWANLRILLRTEDDRWDWEQEEMEEEIINLRMALHVDRLHKLLDLRVCQILTNLGNLFDHVGRFVVAISSRNPFMVLGVPSTRKLDFETILMFYSLMLKNKVFTYLHS